MGRDMDDKQKGYFHKQGGWHRTGEVSSGQIRKKWLIHAKDYVLLKGHWAIIEAFKQGSNVATL